MNFNKKIVTCNKKILQKPISNIAIKKTRSLVLKTFLEDVFTPFLYVLYVLYVSWAFFPTKRHFFLQTINSPCDIFRVFQRVEHESYLLGTKSHLCKKYVFAEAIGVTRHVHRNLHILHNSRIYQFLAKKYVSVLLSGQSI